MTSFSQLGLSEKVLSAVESAGYKEPTPIQAGTIPAVLQRKDVLGIAQTGTGKTASFVLPMLTLLEQGRARARMPRTLILEPTRELAAQVEENFIKYGINHKLNIALLIGGSSFEKQDQKLQRGADVLIATPGRLLDHVERGKLLLTALEILVIDEADRMLDMGFIPDIERICKALPFNRQTLFFSATMAPEISALTNNFLHAPTVVEVSAPSSSAKTITQRLVHAPDKAWEKRKVLRALLMKENSETTNAIIFCNRKKDVAQLCKSLTKHGFNVGALHGDMDQRSRMSTLNSFKEGTLKYLVASDVAARGLDIPDVSHVFNYDLPVHPEDYVHRIGRTGRAGRSGKAFSIVTESDSKYLTAIEEISKQNLQWEDRLAPELTEKQNKAQTQGAESAKVLEPAKERKNAKAHKTSSVSKVAKKAKEHPAKAKETPAKVNHKKELRQAEEESPLGFGKDIPNFMAIKIRH